jgi:hypothetical protein
LRISSSIRLGETNPSSFSQGLHEEDNRLFLPTLRRSFAKPEPGDAETTKKRMHSTPGSQKKTRFMFAFIGLSYDVFGRYGGEEFLILLPGTGMEEAKAMAERIRHTIASSPIELYNQKEPLHITVSIGVSTFFGKSGIVDEALKSANEAMYTAKKTGRNRVVSM